MRNKTIPNQKRLSAAFSRVDLLVVIAIAAMLPAVKFTCLASSRGPGQSAVCMNNLRQLGMALLMYSSENSGWFPPRSMPDAWPDRLRRYYQDLDVLRCPSDGPNPTTAYYPGYPASSAPRSYIYNGWNDYYWQIFGENYLSAARTNSVPEVLIAHPAETITLGEKVTGSPHFYMDFLEGPGNDLTEIEYFRHFHSLRNQNSGGSNFSFADGSVRFLKDRSSLFPTNLWAVTEIWRAVSVAP